MKRAILVSTSTVVGVTAVLSYKPNSDTAKTLLDITGANTTAATTATAVNAAATETTAPQPAAPATPSTTPSATTTPKATATPKQTTTPKPSPSSSTNAKPQASATATPTPSATATPAPTATGGANKTITGAPANAISHGHDYGTVTVTVTLVDGKMAKITATQNPEGRNYPYIQAVRQYLIPAVLKAQQVNVGYVQGATGSSEAFIQSLQSALDKA